jgi:hypothetical protein
MSAGAVAAQSFPSPGVAVVAGKCSKLVVGKFDASKGCKAEVASVTGPDGSVTFVFSSGGKLLGFHGNGRQIKRGGKQGAAQLPLDAVSTGTGDQMAGHVPVTGTCSFANPYSGKPVTIQCSAKSAEMSFAGSFQSNGKPPRSK